MEALNQFISNVIEGNNVAAKELFNQLVAERATEALAERKQEIATRLFQTEAKKNDANADGAGDDSMDEEVELDEGTFTHISYKSDGEGGHHVLYKGKKIGTVWKGRSGTWNHYHDDSSDNDKHGTGKRGFEKAVAAVRWAHATTHRVERENQRSQMKEEVELYEGTFTHITFKADGQGGGHVLHKGKPIGNIYKNKKGVWNHEHYASGDNGSHGTGDKGFQKAVDAVRWAHATTHRVERENQRNEEVEQAQTLAKLKK